MPEKNPAERVNAPLTEPQQTYLEWCLLSTGQRTLMGLPETQLAYSKAKGIPDKTLRNWQAKPAFKQELANRQLAEAGRLAPGLPASTRPAAGTQAAAQSGEQVFELAENTIVAMIEKGDKSMVELYLKTFGKPYLEAKANALQSDFEHLTDDELDRRTLEGIEVGVIVAFLEDQGYEIVRQHEDSSENTPTEEIS